MIQPGVYKADELDIDEFTSYTEVNGNIFLVKIQEITEDSVALHFSGDSITPVRANGTINLLDENKNWNVKIKFGEEYSVITKTMDVGKIWRFKFKK